MSDMSQNERASRPGILRLVKGGVQDCWSRFNWRHSPAPRLVEAGAAAAAEPPGAGATSLWQMRTTVRERPGALAELCMALARARIDIVSLQTHPLGLPGETPSLGLRTGETPSLEVGSGDGSGEGESAAVEETVDEFVLRAPLDLQSADIVELVTGAGGSRTWVERADAHDLVDTPTRVLHLAARTALDSAELPLALRQLLGRCTIRSVPPASPSKQAPAHDVPPEGSWQDTVLRLPDPAGGVLVIERPQLPFTPNEFARARALVELDERLGAASRVPRSADTLTLPEGQPITVRRADSGDTPAAVRMHARCSKRTLSQRYHGPVADADRFLGHLLSPRFGRTLAVETASGKLVALGHLLWDGDETEVALIVEDAWQHRGIGGELLWRLAELAVEAGASSVYAVTQSSNTPMVAAMRGLALPLDYQVEQGTVVITAQLPAAGAATAVIAGAPGDDSRNH